MTTRPILYFEADKIIEDWWIMSVGAQREQALKAWAEAHNKKALILVGGLEVGQVVDYTIRDDRVGLVIQWSNQLDDVGQRGGMVDGD